VESNYKTNIIKKENETGIPFLRQVVTLSKVTSTFGVKLQGPQKAK
jgi:hypothetical protein